jgi:predicted  nucleic acid-binding Zn-ribbon protein
LPIPLKKGKEHEPHIHISGVRKAIIYAKTAQIKNLGGGRKMNQFNRLVSEQMKTMEKLLHLQSELERCQEIEEELKILQQETEIESVQFEISKMKQELKEIQQVFEKQTEEVIDTYQSMNETVYS